MTQSDSDPIYLRALEWFVLMKDEQAGSDERRAFEAWLAASPAHRAAYERASTLWARFDIVTPEYEKLRRPPRTNRRTLLAGSLAVLAGAPLAYWATRPGRFADLTTGIGERRSFTLDDGSTVELGSHSAVSLDLTPRQRRLVLHRGQAFFDVVENAARPFDVEAGAGAVRALGTQFDVKLAGDGASVTVAQHAVRVTPRAGPALTLEEGWQVSYGDGAAPPRPIDVAGATAWRRDRIVFEDVPLRLVLQELERYRRGPIVLAEAGIGAIPVTAVFDTGHADAALRTIGQTLPVRVVDLAGFVAVVYRR